MLHSWAKDSPGRIETIFRELQHAVPSHLLDPGCSTWPGSSLRNKATDFAAEAL